MGASKASISTETRMLERRGVLERVGRAGDRRVYYQVVPELPVPPLELRLERMRRFSGLLIEARREVGRRNRLVRQRLDHMSEAYRYVLAALGAALERWHAAPRRGRRVALKS